jgi:hypothetical protein
MVQLSETGFQMTGFIRDVRLANGHSGYQIQV